MHLWLPGGCFLLAGLLLTAAGLKGLASSGMGRMATVLMWPGVPLLGFGFLLIRASRHGR